MGHAKPYSSYYSWSNLLIFEHNTLHRHTHRNTSAFFSFCALMSKWQPCERDPSCPYGLSFCLSVCLSVCHLVGRSVRWGDRSRDGCIVVEEEQFGRASHCNQLRLCGVVILCHEGWRCGSSQITLGFLLFLVTI